MSSSSVQKIHALSVQKYNNSRKCNVCGKEQPAGFSWVMVTCVCGCDEKKEHVINVLWGIIIVVK